MEQIIFIVWRESVEALLVVGILFTWLRNSAAGRRGLPWLWGGVAAGLGLAVALALVLLGVSSWLPESGQEWFQAFMALTACALVVQMVYWMKRHGRSFKRELEDSATRTLQDSNWWGLLVLVMIAVAREGSETVVFLYGTISGGGAADPAWQLALAGAMGFVAALITFWALQLGGKLISWRRFFQLTQMLLLVLASSLLMSGLDHLISLEALPVVMDPIWDSSRVLDANHGLGKVLADFAGYRAYPALSAVSIWLLYWIVVWRVLRKAEASSAHSASPCAARA